MTQDATAINKFARSIAKYVTTNKHFEGFGRERVAIEAVTVVLTDQGAGTEALTYMSTEALIEELIRRGCTEERRKSIDDLHFGPVVGWALPPTAERLLILPTEGTSV